MSHVPFWFFKMVRDQRRIESYEKALRQVIRPGYRVLEIGTGTGLFSMMAARAGAKEVVTCETNPAVAAAALETIARNGFADRVHVITNSCSNLKVGVDFNDRADALIWDVLDNSVIGAGGLPLIQHAIQHLLLPNAPVIPARGCIRIALIEDHSPPEHQMPSSVEGFNLSAFDSLAHPWYYLASTQSVAQRSEPENLFRFNFLSGTQPDTQTSVSLATSGGRVNGIIQWLRIETDESEWYENNPFRGDLSAHLARIWWLGRPITMARGGKLRVMARQSGKSLRIWTSKDGI